MTFITYLFCSLNFEIRRVSNQTIIKSMMIGFRRVRSAINSSRSVIRAFNSSSSSSDWCGNRNSRRSLVTSGIDAASYHLSGGPSYMRGAVFWEPNKPLTFEDFNMPRPKAGEILIKTKGKLYSIIYTYILFDLN